MHCRCADGYVCRIVTKRQVTFFEILINKKHNLPVYRPRPNLSVGQDASPRPEKYRFNASLRRDSASFGRDEEQAVSLPLAKNHVSEFSQSVRELLQYQLDMINTAALALATGNRAEGDELDGARQAHRDRRVSAL
ncbi:hypothetical protein SGGMMB4_01288 [Sodalis glossinidius str. 'morsitans']|uniref:Uncharacterized protein n=1 Tax=Sodalis glossinidius (strain morsitans) TaxID=343509 RepID=A0A193QH75_SODGM|nr:hypothetical protein SGGMMB4_01288 [Sodalis glossinidius str. 'morsitans']